MRLPAQLPPPAPRAAAPAAAAPYPDRIRIATDDELRVRERNLRELPLDDPRRAVVDARIEAIARERAHRSAIATGPRPNYATAVHALEDRHLEKERAR